MRSLAMLSMHTSPLAQPGTGDGGGLNVYVRELAAALARTGVTCDVYTRADDRQLPAVVDVEPGFRVHHLACGPLAPVAKEALEPLVEEFADAVMARMECGFPAEALHANYWLSGAAGHIVKHALDLPLVCTFHTLARVKAESDDDEPERRARAEARIIGCSEAVLASCAAEADQLVGLYGADPDRIAVLSPAVDHAFFSPGDRRAARRAVGVDPDRPLLLFAGRIQPLKGADVAVAAFALAVEEGGPAADAQLLVIGGPSGPRGRAHLDDVRALAEQSAARGRVRFLPPQPHELLSCFFRAADVVVVPSRSESFGLVALEAAACGTPVVASAVGGLTNIVRDGETGILVDDRAPAAFARATADLLGDAERASAMGRSAAEWASRFRWSATALRLRALYDELTERVLVDCS